jgi:hypothetical protein
MATALEDCRGRLRAQEARTQHILDQKELMTEEIGVLLGQVETVVHHIS